MKPQIDLVVPWVDGNDVNWQKEKLAYTAPKDGDQRIIRYRDWGLMKYWFRGVEKALPWIRKIHFITWGHLPEFLNTDNPKLNIVKHSDYIPTEYLPTFSSHTIELNLHKIKDLSEHFIYANDDTFFMHPLKETFFFSEEGLPLDAAIQNVLQFRETTGVAHITANDLTYLNMNFRKGEVIRKNKKNWYNLSYGKKMFYNIYTKPFQNFTGFDDIHLPFSYKKSTWLEVWDKCGDILSETCSHKVRTQKDVNQWLMRYWQFASGTFSPSNPYRGDFLIIGKDDEKIEKIIKNTSSPMICLSDDYEDLSFEKERDFLIECFEVAFPEKSSFEV